jgi:hypothetical protein
MSGPLAATLLSVLWLAEPAAGSCDCLCCSGGSCSPTVVGVAPNRTACHSTFGTACNACGSLSAPGVCAPVCDLPSLAVGGTRYNYTGAAQSYVVPPGVHTLNITAAGSEGGPAHNGFAPAKGGLSTALLPVRPGQTLHVYVGGPGREADSFDSARGGFNGGGAGQSGTSGGGGSDVRSSPSLEARVVVAGGGAGSPFSGGVGGAGGGGSGEAGESGFDGKKGGGAGTQTSGGACGGSSVGSCAGTAGKGGDCAQRGALLLLSKRWFFQQERTRCPPNHDAVQLCCLTLADFFCSGGGGGWYGGGSSGDGSGAGAGGGSGYIIPGAPGSMIVGAHAGAGYIDVTPVTNAVRDRAHS